MKLYTSSTSRRISRNREDRLKSKSFLIGSVISHHFYDRCNCIWVSFRITNCRNEICTDSIISNSKSLKSNIGLHGSSSKVIHETIQVEWRSNSIWLDYFGNHNLTIIAQSSDVSSCSSKILIDLIEVTMWVVIRDEKSDSTNNHNSRKKNGKNPRNIRRFLYFWNGGIDLHKWKL